MKKVLAIMLSIAMLFGVLAINASAEGTPTVTLVTNEGSPVVKDTVTYLSVNFKNFSTIKGMDVTISAEGAQLGAVTVTGFNSLTENENFTEVNTNEKHEIHIVDLTKGESEGKITFQVTAPAKTAPIKVTGKYADSGKTLFTIADSIGNLEVKKEIATEVIEPEEGKEITKETPVIIEQPKAEEGEETPDKFIPYGSVYKVDEETGKISYAEKDIDGNFTVTEAGYQVQSFDVPENGITTYGVSEEINNQESIRFGSFSNKAVEGTTHGTMVFHGNWLLLKNYYIQKGYSVQEFTKALYDNFDKVMKQNPGADFVSYKLQGEEIRVYKFAQKNYMWKDGSGTLEYALRLTGIKPNNTYTAIAYSIDSEGTSTISKEVKSFTTPAQ